MTTIGINFRDTSGFVSDGVGDTYCLKTDTYPTTRGGVTFGWEDTGAQDSRDRTTGSPNNPKLSGINFVANGGGATAQRWRLDLDTAAQHTVESAWGDQGSGQIIDAQMRDGTTAFVTYASTSTGANDAYYDSTGTLRTTAALWLANQTSVTRTFASTIFRCVFNVTNTATQATALARLGIAAVGGATSIGPPRRPFPNRGPLRQNYGARVLGFEQGIVTAVSSDIASVGVLSITGSASLTAIGTVAAAGTLTITGAALLRATGTVASAGTLVITATAALTSTGTLASAGTLVINGAASLTAPGTLTASGTLVINGAAALTGLGSLASAGTAVINGAADLTSTSANDIASAGSIVITSSAALSAIGSLASSGALVITGLATLDDGAAVVTTQAPTGSVPGFVRGGKTPRRARKPGPVMREDQVFGEEYPVSPFTATLKSASDDEHARKSAGYRAVIAALLKELL